MTHCGYAMSTLAHRGNPIDTCQTAGPQDFCIFFFYALTPHCHSVCVQNTILPPPHTTTTSTEVQVIPRKVSRWLKKSGLATRRSINGHQSKCTYLCISHTTNILTESRGLELTSGVVAERIHSVISWTLQSHMEQIGYNGNWENWKISWSSQRDEGNVEHKNGNCFHDN